MKKQGEKLSRDENEKKIRMLFANLFSIFYAHIRRKSELC